MMGRPEKDLSKDFWPQKQKRTRHHTFVSRSPRYFVCSLARISVEDKETVLEWVEKMTLKKSVHFIGKQEAAARKEAVLTWLGTDICLNTLIALLTSNKVSAYFTSLYISTCMTYALLIHVFYTNVNTDQEPNTKLHNISQTHPDWPNLHWWDQHNWISTAHSHPQSITCLAHASIYDGHEIMLYL